MGKFFLGNERIYERERERERAITVPSKGFYGGNIKKVCRRPRIHHSFLITAWIPQNVKAFFRQKQELTGELKQKKCLWYNKNMPELSRFLGIIIAMYFEDHNPPHFHVIYNEFDAEIEINRLSILTGKLPARILGLAIEWAELHKDELMDDWNLLQKTGKYNKIQPLI